MSALRGGGAINVYTHDSIGLGEDGPTHQPVEHLAALRFIPRNDVWRTCDAVESAVAWKAAIERREGPSCLVFSRQNLPHQARDEAPLQARSDEPTSELQSLMRTSYPVFRLKKTRL